ncbi:hypothetical protein FE156_12255 [Streptomyces albidoflavus]|nr:hypothetical protein FE156_12255 [Streptomyces albidoflavus]
MAASCAVCCGGTPTRPHPTVSYAANRRGRDGGRPRYRASPQRPPSSLQLVTQINGWRPVFSPPTGGTTPTRRKGGDGSGCPRSKLHTEPS